MIKRIGHCIRCARCCKSFIILAGAMSDFKRAQDKYGLKLIANPDGKTFRCSMLIDNLCRIHEDKPRACREAPRTSFPWKCGYKFVYEDTTKKDIEETRKSLKFFEGLPKIKKTDEDTKSILNRNKEGSEK